MNLDLLKQWVLLRTWSNKQNFFAKICVPSRLQTKLQVLLLYPSSVLLPPQPRMHLVELLSAVLDIEKRVKADFLAGLRVSGKKRVISYLKRTRLSSRMPPGSARIVM